jgi:hypothetical protein
MKRDMDLVRQILITIEDHEHGFAPETIEVPGYTEETIGYHLVLMGEAGLLKVVDMSPFGAQTPQAIVERLTWDATSLPRMPATKPFGTRSKAS